MLLLAICLLGMDENDYGIGNLLFDFLIRSFVKGFGMSFPTKASSLGNTEASWRGSVIT